MRKIHSGMKKVLPLALGLALGGTIGTVKAYSQEINDSFWNRTGDFAMVTDYKHDLKRDEVISIDSIMSGGNVKNIYAIDPIVGFSNRIKSLKQRLSIPEAKRLKEDGFYTDEQICLLIKRYQGFINELQKLKRPNYSKSLENLTQAVKDGTVIPRELENVEGGYYFLVKEGTGAIPGPCSPLENKTPRPYAVYALVKLSNKDGSQYPDLISITEIDAPVEKESEKIVEELPSPKVDDKPKAEEKPIVKSTPILPEEPKSKIILKPKEEVVSVDVPKAPERTWEEETGRNKQKGVYVSLLAEGTSNFVPDYFSGNLGIRLNPINNKNIGFGAALDVGFGLDRLVDSYTCPLSAGRTGIGAITETNQSLIGLLADLQLGPVVIGGGLNCQNWLKTISEKIVDPCGDVVKSNTNSLPNRQVFGKVYGGVEVPLSDTVKLGATVGYDGRNGMYAGLRSIIKLNQPRKEKK